MSNAATARAIADDSSRVADRHVEQRAVRLDVLHRHAFGGGDAGDRGHLIQHHVLGFLRRHVQLAAAEADQIRKAGMRADGDAVRSSRDGSCRAAPTDRRREIPPATFADVIDCISPASWPIV